MPPSPIARRLQSDFEKVQKLVNESGGTLDLVSTRGTPPTAYVIEYHCPSLVKTNKGTLVLRQKHQVEIILGSSYPFSKPEARMLTQVFNPHVFLNNAICLGVVWSPAETLDTLILKIGALLQLDPKVLDPFSPANSEANAWVQNNRARLPIGSISFKAGADDKSKSEPRITWS